MTKSHKWVDNGIKFVYLSGDTPYEIGYQHGRLLKKEIGKITKEIKKIAKKKVGSLLTQLIMNYLFYRSRKLKKNFSNDVLQEMKGISDGSGQKIEWVLFANTIYEIGASISHSFSFGACSCFITTYDNSKDTVLGKTTDIINFLSDILTRNRTIFIYDCKWLRKKYITPSFPLTLIGDSVILENGDILALNDGNFAYKNDNFRNTPIISILKEVSWDDNNVPKMMEKIKKYSTIKPFVLLLTDGKTDNSFVIELCGDDREIRRFGKYLIDTNLFLTEKMRKKCYKRNYKKKSMGCIKRRENIESKIEKISRPGDVIDILKTHEKTFRMDKGSISNTKTVQGIVYYPTEGKILLPTGNRVPVTYYGKWVEFNIDNIFNHQCED